MPPLRLRARLRPLGQTVKRLLPCALAVAVVVAELIRDGYAYPIVRQVYSLFAPRPETEADPIG